MGAELSWSRFGDVSEGFCQSVFRPGLPIVGLPVAERGENVLERHCGKFICDWWNVLACRDRVPARKPGCSYSPRSSTSAV